MLKRTLGLPFCDKLGLFQIAKFACSFNYLILINTKVAICARLISIYFCYELYNMGVNFVLAACNPRIHGFPDRAIDVHIWIRVPMSV